MHVRGLLVEDHNGQDFLLSTESRAGMRRHQLVALQRINGQWKPVKGPEESACRELLIGAFVDFFVDICRVLNSSGADRTWRSLPCQVDLARDARSISKPGDPVTRIDPTA